MQNAVNNMAKAGSGHDPRSPMSQLEEPTPIGFRTEYLTFKQAITTVNDGSAQVDYS